MIRDLAKPTVFPKGQSLIILWVFLCIVNFTFAKTSFFIIAQLVRVSFEKSQNTIKSSTSVNVIISAKKVNSMMQSPVDWVLDNYRDAFTVPAGRNLY